jgi:hypothetical protein
VVSGVFLSGCGSDPSVGPRQAAKGFASALVAGDGQAACAVLAPATKSELEQSSAKTCASAITEERLPEAGAVRRSTVYGSMAQVSFTGDTMFVAQFKTGWKVMAAGCSPVPGHPYDCELQGG